MTDVFLWEDAELFTSLANLLRLRKRPCLGPMEWQDEDTEDATHACAGDDLKRRFLDGFAKVLSHDQGGKYVACVALRESGNVDLEEPDGAKVTLLVARNEAFEDYDRSFCNRVEQLLAALSAFLFNTSVAPRGLTETFADPAVEEALWEAILDYNEPRLEQYVLNFEDSVLAFADSGYLDRLPTYYLVQTLGDYRGVGAFCDSDEIGPYCKATHNAYMQFAQAHIRELRDILSIGDRAVQGQLLAEKAYSIRHMESVRIFINAYCDALGSQLLSDIHFLGRLMSCYHILVEAAKTIPGFIRLSIELVNKPRSHKFSATLPSLGTVFKWLNIPLNPTTVQKFVRDTRVGEVGHDFFELQEKAYRKPLYTHAEIQLVFYIAQGTHPRTVTKEFYPYIGCSKLCCFLCFTFLRFFGQPTPFFRVRGCHGRVYSRWSLPEAEGLHTNMCMKLYLALQSTLHHMSREMTTAVAARPYEPERTESSAGITDDYPSSYIHDYHTELTIQSEFHAIHAAMAAESSNKTFEAAANVEMEDDRAKFTQYSYRPPSKVCEGAYNLSDHSFKCAIGRPLDSADYLQRACWRQEIPDDIDTLEEFGFTKFPSTFDQRNLLGVFIGLTHMGIGCQELRRWKEGGTLVPNIISIYEGNPEYRGRRYYRWFRENLCILSLTDTKINNTPDMFAIARPHLDPYDRSKDLHEIVPDAKRKSLLYAILLNGWYPDPSHSEKSVQDLYYTFGFCLCCDIHGKQALGTLYRTLISRCSFQDFWLAYESHSLISLMDAKGLKGARQNIRFLACFLTIRPNRWCPTVWYLRLFTQSQAALPGRYVASDYGFFNCETVEEHFALKETYKLLLQNPDVNPMGLHAACIHGELYSFARMYLPNLQWRFRELMKNSYPTYTNAEKAGKWPWASPVHCQSGWGI
ncbi:hypothetical protein EDC04DRAFT_3142746 [Pisolithus marmoratus]|nr:hypothetical protein EDC04DRAFT_3142746 [Pisolithus marmoratus]